EVAKLRAARRLWAKIMRERFAAQNHQSWMMRIHAETAGSTLMANMPDVNTIRVAYQALSAVLGGTQSLYTSYRDSASPLPNPPAERVALNTHKIIANEIGVADTVDPLGGSYYIESLTTKIEEEVNIYLDKIDALGGAIDAIENGFFQQEIQQSAYLYQKQLESRDSVLIGQTNYKSDYEEPSFLPKVDPLTIERQVARLHATKNMRDQQQVFKALQKLRHIAQSSSNVMPAIIDAVRVYATLGEICAILRDVFGIYKEPA
ncbi:MAG: methylmalonyl-CoA mutase family protein, partial [Firmicutes bacterium]|nr:methylmalonyl-CoA mutase family protein [Bacillota bacterium]